MKRRGAVDERFAVIMAGGRGERFWPVSREKTPKQLLRLLGKRSFLQEAVERVRRHVPRRNVFVITGVAQAVEVRRQLAGIPEENVVAEPMGRDTCAAVALGAALVGARSARGVMAILPADHVIPDSVGFGKVLTDCFEVAGRESVMVTIGIEPTEAATGYGYVQLGRQMRLGKGRDSLRTRFFWAERFVEKPGLEQAARYVESGEYRWNAGMFIWSYGTVMEALREHRFEMYEASERWRRVADQPVRLARALAADYPGIERISIDYAVMEHARNVVVADGTFAWDDVGSWNALGRHLKRDAAGNYVVGELVQVDGVGNIVYDARTRKTPVAVVGQRDTILVLTDDVTMMAGKGESQKIKELVRKLGAGRRYRRLV
jgi:mannose-1-phosphate guanylyltransferase